jgi:hypothetical protein
VTARRTKECDERCLASCKRQTSHNLPAMLCDLLSIEDQSMKIQFHLLLSSQFKVQHKKVALAGATTPIILQSMHMQCTWKLSNQLQ